MNTLDSHVFNVKVCITHQSASKAFSATHYKHMYTVLVERLCLY